NDELTCTSTAPASQNELLDTLVDGRQRLVVDPELVEQSTSSAKDAAETATPSDDIESAADDSVEGQARYGKGDKDKDDDGKCGKE
ncbi:hypothetical protein GGI21_004825, partial [Coemansia aciculifera]